jgi:hypothetical protein
MYRYTDEDKLKFQSKIAVVCTEISNVSEIIEDEVNFKWKINKWQSICPDDVSNFEPCRSPHVTTTGNGPDPSVWFFELRNTRGYLSLYLCEYSCDKNANENSKAHGRKCYPQPLTCHFKVVDHEGGVLLEADGTSPCFHVQELPMLDREQHLWNDQISVSPDPCNHSHWLNFIHLRELFHQRDSYFLNDAINFEINFKVPYFHVCGESKLLKRNFGCRIQEALDKLVNASQASLAADISRMFLFSDNSDFVINCENYSFPIHKHIILGRCRKLYNVLMRGTGGKFTALRQHTDPVLTNSALLSNIDPASLRGMIEFIYKGSFSGFEDLNQLKLLLSEANNYDLQSLNDLCFAEIIGLLNVETVASIILLADSYVADDNIIAYLNKFCQEHQEELLRNETFSECVQRNPSAFQFLDICKEQLLPSCVQ